MRRLVMGLMLMAGVGASAMKPKPELPSGKVGVAVRVFHPKEARDWRGAETKELRVRVWYPAVGTAVETQQFEGPPGRGLFEAGAAAVNAEMAPALSGYPLIMLSHGTGGSALQMAWLGTALARAGFVAAAVDHPGNNSNEAYTPAGFLLLWERATDLSNVIDGMLADAEFGKRIDASRIGAAGFSLGGYTVLELAGARTDLSQYFDICRARPENPACQVPEMKGMGSMQQVLEAVRKTDGVSLARSAESYRDVRVKAAFAISPPAREVLTEESLHELRVAVEVVAGADDPIIPPADSVEYLRQYARGMRGFVLPGGVEHYTFLDTCTAAGREILPRLCTDKPGVDRNAVHAQVAGMAAEFFVKALQMR
ncbi:MAG: peptidase [Acidobacteriota bacterium]